MLFRLSAPCLLLVALAVACGDGSTPAASPTASITSSTAGTSGTRAPTASGASAAQRTLDLSRDKPLTTILGADSGDYFNDMPLLAMGDVNGDGRADLLIGARFGDGPGNARTDAGEAYLILGRDKLPESLDLAAGQADVTIYGASGQGAASQQGDQVSYSGALADVNGDGMDDIILGSPFRQEAANTGPTGAVYVIAGRPSFPPVIDLASAPADLMLTGDRPASFFGDSVAASDLNGDGVKDIAVGAPFEPRPNDRKNGGQLAGATFVFFGSREWKGQREAAKQQYDAVIYGAEEFEGSDEMGDNLAGGDLNHDGIGDIVITAEAADGPNNDRSVAAEVYVVYGSQTFGGVLDTASGDQDVTVYGAEQNDTLGFNIGAGDVTGDGVDDLLVSARGGDGANNRVPEAGELHIFPGGNLPKTIDLASYPDDIYLYGQDPADFLGNALGTLDWDGDGAPDLFVGSPGGDGPANDPNTRDAGEGFVLDARSLRGGTAVMSAPLKLALYGAAGGDALGSAMAAGDMDGDGRPELSIEAMRSDGPGGSRPDAGEILIIGH